MKKRKKPRNAQDTTLRNTQAANKRFVLLDARLDDLERRVKELEAKVPQ